MKSLTVYTIVQIFRVSKIVFKEMYCFIQQNALHWNKSNQETMKTFIMFFKKIQKNFKIIKKNAVHLNFLFIKVSWNKIQYDSFYKNIKQHNCFQNW